MARESCYGVSAFEVAWRGGVIRRGVMYIAARATGAAASDAEAAAKAAADGALRCLWGAGAGRERVCSIPVIIRRKAPVTEAEAEGREGRGQGDERRYISRSIWW